ncbi:hypothetical protein IAT38_007053 [Cryptococcus sp. DSM 104549]
MRSGSIFYRFSGTPSIDGDNDSSHSTDVEDDNSDSASSDSDSRMSGDDKQSADSESESSADSICEGTYGGDSDIEQPVSFAFKNKWLVKLTFAAPDALPHSLFLGANDFAELGHVPIDDDLVYKVGYGKEPTAAMSLNNNPFAYLTLSPNNENIYIHYANDRPCTILRHAYEPSKLQDVRCMQVIDKDILVLPVSTGPGDQYEARIRVDFRGQYHEGGFMNQLLYMDWRNECEMSPVESMGERMEGWLREVRKNLIAEQVEKMPSGLEEEKKSKETDIDMSYARLLPTCPEPVVPPLPRSQPETAVTTPVSEPCISPVTVDEDDEMPEAGPSSRPALPSTHSYPKRARSDDFDDLAYREMRNTKRHKPSASAILGGIGIAAMGAVMGSLGTLWGLLSMDDE